MAFRTIPLYEAAPIGKWTPVASHTTLEALNVFDASPDVFVIITHNFPLGALEFCPKAELTLVMRVDSIASGIEKIHITCTSNGFGLSPLQCPVPTLITLVQF